MATVKVEGLTKRFGAVEAVSDLSFTLKDGAVTGFLGPNGAGKSTTLKMLLGLVEPSAGKATIDGRRYTELRDPIRHVGAVLEAPTFHPGRRARIELEIMAAAAGIPPGRVDEVLEEVGLTEAAGRRIGGFSLGMRQRLGLAAALLGDPGLLILDEPTNGLDPAGVHWLRSFLRTRAERGSSVLISSHLLAEVSLSADEVIIINRGKLVSQGPVDVLTARGGGVKIKTPQGEELRDLLISKGIEAQLSGPEIVRARNTAGETIGGTVAEAGIVVYEMCLEHADLEDLFLQLTSDEKETAK